MKELLSQKFFPYVTKPGRYAGGEPGSIAKNPEGRVNYLHAFPDKYELGQSYLGLQTLYHIVNKDDRFLCERVFAVDRDAEEVMRREGIPLFSLETRRPASEFDAIGFTLPYELVYTNMLAMLDLAAIPLKSKERTDQHPLVMAGGPAVYNPQPLADFVDVFFIGDAEEGLPEMLRVLHECRDDSRQEKLAAICRQVDSVYIPALYDDNQRPRYDFVPVTVTARVERELRPEFYPRQPVVPLVDTAHNHLAVEIMRGCPQGCRYCQAGPIYRPVRHRPQREILEQVETQLAWTGQEEISLVSLSSSDYPQIEELADVVARRVEKKRVSIALPSLRPGTVSPQLLDAVMRVRKAGLTISPEAGTERLRFFIRKDIPDTAIHDTARIAFERGWTSIKLYFMVGLPTETEDDLQGIVRTIKDVYDIGFKYPGKKTINVTLSPFVPKAHTPFQWDGMLPADELLSRIKFIKKRNHINRVHFKYPQVETSALQGALGRGGREMGRVIEGAFVKGCRFDGWSEDFDYDSWLAAFSEAGISLEDSLGPIAFEAALPWSVVSKGPDKEHLLRERQRTSLEHVEYKGTPVAAGHHVAEPEPPAQNYGRGKKKAAARSLASAPTKNRVRIRWGKDDRLKYLSHLDNMRIIERAIRRAGLPVAFSQGFNPTMKLSFGPPLPLGFTSESEFVDITLEANLMPYMLEKLRQSLPEGIRIYEAKVVSGKVQSLSAVLNRVKYRVATTNIPQSVDLKRSIDGVMESPHLEVSRVGKNRTSVVDIRPAIYEICVHQGALETTLGIGEGGYARLSEVLPLLLGDRFEEHLLYSVHRCSMFRVDQKGEPICAMDV
ncbi:MAG: TIGR03960 family B12-binding radical SAM protein [Candidatus Zixiibacteriota bacterium]|nr:MAG: TIGR03960 family B12-binding radical SAM protein [candidate division Zixibacteria bacterium]